MDSASSAEFGFPLWLIPVLIPILFAGLWTGIVAAAAVASGWRRLARTCPGGARPEGKTFRWQTLWIGAAMSYQNSINVTFADAGVYLAPFALFRVKHPPLLFPWELVGPLEERGWLFRRPVLPIDAEGLRLQLYLSRAAARWVGERHTGVLASDPRGRAR